MLIKQIEAAKLLGVTKAAISKLKAQDTIPGFIVDQEQGPWMVDTSHPDWQKKLEYRQRKTSGHMRPPVVKVPKPPKPEKPEKVKTESRPVGRPKKPRPEGLPEQAQKVKVVKLPEQSYEPPKLTRDQEEMQSLEWASIIADREKIISNAVIAAQKAEQEKIKTLQIKKELAPIDLIKHFFSFSENMIQRIYRRPHEISPQVEALYFGKEPRKAVQLIIREMEAIIKDSQQELIQAIEEEEYNIKKLVKAKKKDE